jgi:hypothetical protein
MRACVRKERKREREEERDLELAEGLVNAARKNEVVDSKVAFTRSERRDTGIR